MHGFPNYFLVGGPDAGDRVHDVAGCLALMAAGSRIEVRRSTQQVFNERAHLHRPPRRPTASAFELSSSGTTHDDVYDGATTLVVGDVGHRVRARLTGHVDPIDGRFQWQGTIFGHLPDDVLKQPRAVTPAVGERAASARITGQTPQGTHSIVGVGPPPFALEDVEVAVIQL